jgi:hypothetical protein
MRQLSPLLLALCLTACSTATPASNSNPSSSPKPDASSPAVGAPSPTAEPGLMLPVFSKISTLAGTREQVSKDGTLEEARFYSPTGVVSNGAGTVYVADEGAHVIRKITASGVTTFAGTGVAGYKDGAGDQAQFRNPWDLVLDLQGNLYVADSGNHRIRKIAPDGTVSTLAGNGKNAFANGPALEASFFSPTGITRDAENNFYVADQTNNLIRKISPSGEVSTLAGAADNSNGLKDGRGSEALFRRPSDVVMTSGGLYVADDGNHAIRKITSDGTVSTVVGAGARSQGATDGPAAEARLNGPVSLTTDIVGNLYFVEFNGNAVRKMTPDGTVTSLIRGIPPGFVDGPLAEGKVNAPTGIFFDGQVMYIADRDNHRVRKID